MKIKLKVMAAIVCATLCVQPPPVEAQFFGVGGATEFTQILNNIELARSYVEQARAAQLLFQQYQGMLKNLEQMTPDAQLDAATRKMWSDNNMSAVFADLKRVISGGNELAYSSQNVDAMFRKSNPGYGNNGNNDYTKSYKDWTDSTLSAVRSSTKAVVTQSEDLQSESQMIDALVNQSKSATGALSAIQAGNAISTVAVNQLQKLRTLQMAQMQTQNAYTASKQNQENAKKEKIDKWIENMKGAKPVESKEKKEWYK